MNILPKKRWHVRTKDNIARVRRDEAAAREEEKKRLDKSQLAESEARVNFLRRQSGLPENVPKETTQGECADQHPKPESYVGLFEDFLSHVKKTNKDLEKEKKEEQEKYEKQIGYLTYLGQDTNEALKVRSWYELPPSRTKKEDNKEAETQLKSKLSEDPLTLLNTLIPKRNVSTATKEQKRRHSQQGPVVLEGEVEAKKEKKDKRHSKKHEKHKHKKKKSKKDRCELAKDEKRDKLNQMRKERLAREQAERHRQDQLLAPKGLKTQTDKITTPAATPKIVQKYNSQFNPELAKQNMI